MQRLVVQVIDVCFLRCFFSLCRRPVGFQLVAAVALPDSDGALQDFNDLESPAEFETREEFCKAVRNSLKAVAARVEKDSEQERIRAVYDTLLCKTMFSE